MSPILLEYYLTVLNSTLFEYISRLVTNKEQNQKDSKWTSLTINDVMEFRHVGASQLDITFFGLEVGRPCNETDWKINPS